ncbi:MAG: tRNA uridine-5-carboxymethylaminomethyl(34) synthesis GTPase MnmE [Maricaulaceae bacterium]
MALPSAFDTQIDTIFSLSSAPGRAGIAVFRVSGPKTGKIMSSLIDRSLPKPRFALFATFLGPKKSHIDEGLLLWMPGPASFTGEDCAECHVHGSPAVIEKMASTFLSHGARQSEAGEFTRRAFANGKMDLTEAEGLADLIDADTEGQRRQALRQMQGGLKNRYENWREALLDGLAQIEGEIDFPDEADIPDDLAHKADAPLKDLCNDMQKALLNADRGERVRSGLDIALIGAPNAGKSSLINILVDKEAAIVTHIPGTTRDVLEVNLVMAGLPIRLFDTAGLRQSDDEIEAEGVRRALARAQESDIRILVHDANDTVLNDDAKALLVDGDIFLINKTDINVSRETLALPIENIHRYNVSAKTGSGMDTLRQALEDIVTDRFSPSQDAGLTRARHRNCVERASQSVQRARDVLNRAPELAGDDLRAALHALKELAGETDIEAVFDRIFSRFCVGK